MRSLRLKIILLLGIVGVVQVALSQNQMPKQFELYYEYGVGPVHDSFDSDKKTRTIDAVQGPFTYTAELTEFERQQIYEAILQNNLLAVKDDFTNLGNRRIMPESTGKLRINIDDKMKEIRFNGAYGWKFRNNKEAANSADSEEWTRFSNVRGLIEAILKTKDAAQKLPPHRVYL